MKTYKKSCHFLFLGFFFFSTLNIKASNHDDHKPHYLSDNKTEKTRIISESKLLDKTGRSSKSSEIAFAALYFMTASLLVTGSVAAVMHAFDLRWNHFLDTASANEENALVIPSFIGATALFLGGGMHQWIASEEKELDLIEESFRKDLSDNALEPQPIKSDHENHSNFSELEVLDSEGFEEEEISKISNFLETHQEEFKALSKGLPTGSWKLISGKSQNKFVYTHPKLAQYVFKFPQATALLGSREFNKEIEHIRLLKKATKENSLKHIDFPKTALIQNSFCEILISEKIQDALETLWNHPSRKRVLSEFDLLEKETGLCDVSPYTKRPHNAAWGFDLVEDKDGNIEQVPKIILFDVDCIENKAFTYTVYASTVFSVFFLILSSIYS